MIWPEIAVNNQFWPLKSKVFVKSHKKSKFFGKFNRKSKFLGNCLKNRNSSEICLEKSKFFCEITLKKSLVLQKFALKIEIFCEITLKNRNSPEICLENRNLL